MKPRTPPAWMLPRPAKAGRLHAIIAGVAAAYGVTVADIKGRRRMRRFAWARQVSVWLCKRLTGLGNLELAPHFRREQSGMGHCVRAVDSAREIYPEIARELAALEEKLRKEIE